jgi:hypothetical protein
LIAAFTTPGNEIVVSACAGPVVPGKELAGTVSVETIAAPAGRALKSGRVDVVAAFAVAAAGAVSR